LTLKIIALKKDAEF